MSIRSLHLDELIAVQMLGVEAQFDSDHIQKNPIVNNALIKLNQDQDLTETEIKDLKEVLFCEIKIQEMDSLTFHNDTHVFTLEMEPAGKLLRTSGDMILAEKIPSFLRIFYGDGRGHGDVGRKNVLLLVFAFLQIRKLNILNPHEEYQLWVKYLAKFKEEEVGSLGSAQFIHVHDFGNTELWGGLSAFSVKWNIHNQVEIVPHTQVIQALGSSFLAQYSPTQINLQQKELLIVFSDGVEEMTQDTQLKKSRIRLGEDEGFHKKLMRKFLEQYFQGRDLRTSTRFLPAWRHFLNRYGLLAGQDDRSLLTIRLRPNP